MINVALITAKVSGRLSSSIVIKRLLMFSCNSKAWNYNIGLPSLCGIRGWLWPYKCWLYRAWNDFSLGHFEEYGPFNSCLFLILWHILPGLEWPRQGTVENVAYDSYNPPDCCQKLRWDLLDYPGKRIYM